MSKDARADKGECASPRVERTFTMKREFPTAVVASITSGTLLCQFSDMHEAAEWLMGHPIWTHHFGDKKLWERMAAAVHAQCPGMPRDGEITKENWREKKTQIEAACGPMQTIAKGNATPISPLDGIPAHADVIVLSNDRTEAKQ